MNRRGWNLPARCAFLVTLCAVCVSLAPPLRAQIRIGGGFAIPAKGTAQKPDTESGQNVFRPPDRKLVQYLNRARELAAEKRFGEAIRYLQLVLDGPEDFFFQPDKAQPQTHHSLKAEAQQLIGQMPRAGREAYELRCGAEARAMLADAVASGEPGRLGETSRRFFYTESGMTATLLLGLHHLDHGRPLAGALILKRLVLPGENHAAFEPTLSLTLATCWLQAGMTDKAVGVLTAFRQRQGKEPLEIAGKQISWFQTPDEASTWLVDIVGEPRVAAHAAAAEWSMLRGNPARNARSHGGAPLLNLRWSVPASEDQSVERMLVQLRDSFQEQSAPLLPGFHPLVVDDVVLMRTPRYLWAVDFVTGRRLWHSLADDPLEALLSKTSSSSRLPPAPFGGVLPVQATAQVIGQLGHRMREDSVFGTLSSDGRYVFSVEDTPIGPASSSTIRRAIIITPNRTTSTAGSYNRLAANDIHTGKLMWNLGSSPEDGLPLAGTFFLGPPLPLRGQLYVLAEIKKEITLLALDARSGNLLWSQPLALVDEALLGGIQRRSVGASPSYADGILVCPTAAGAVVGVELATRALLWGHTYAGATPSSRRAALLQLQMMRSRGVQQTTRWADGTAMIEDGRVLVTPVASNSLYCLNLIDGTLAWEKPLPREDNLFAACAHKGNVILVGRDGVQAVNLSDGKPAWDGRTIDLPEGALPSGHGVFTGDRYYLPLSTAEIVGIDLAAGKIVQVSKSRIGTVPGNLICYKDRMISQGFDGLEVFSLLESFREVVDERLAANPDDPEAITQQGEILLDQGKRTEAIACFARANELTEDVRTRGLLRDALLDGLRTDFPSYRAQTARIEALLETSGQKAAYWRVLGAGLQAAGEKKATLEQYLKLLDLDEEYRRMDPISNALTVRRDRWFQAQLSTLREEAQDGPDQETIEAIDTEVRTRLEAARQADDASALAKFLDFFGDDPAAATARQKQRQQFQEDNDLLRAENLLRRRQESPDPTIAGPATAELAAMFREAEKPSDAAACYAELATHFADVVCLEGKTGKQLRDELTKNDPVRTELQRKHDWPTGLVESEKTARKSGTTSYYGRYPVQYGGDPGPFFVDTTIRYEYSRNRISAFDALGKQLWQAPTVKSGATNRISFSSALAQVRVRGHLLVMYTGNTILAVDTLKSSSDGSRELLWRHDLNASNSATSFHGGNFALQGNVFIVNGAIVGGTSTNSGGLGPVTDRYIGYQRLGYLVAIDPLTGETFWTRRNIPRGSELFGDDEFFFALPPGRDEALVFRATDGQQLGTRKIPLAKLTQAMPDGTTKTTTARLGQSCLAMFGRRLLRWQTIEGQEVLELFDPWEQKSSWPARKFALGAKACMARHDAVGLFEPNGHFTLLSLPDGQEVVSTDLNPAKNLREIFLLHMGQQYLLVTHDYALRPAGAVSYSPMPGSLSRQITKGDVYCFNEQGESLWPKPVSIENQYLLLDQPAELPVLILASQGYQRNALNSVRYQTRIECIDKRTGRKAYQQTDAVKTRPRTFDLLGKPDEDTIEIGLYTENLKLKFTGKPIPPPEEETKAKTTGEAILRALKKAAISSLTGEQDTAETPQPIVVPPPIAIPPAIPLPEPPPPAIAVPKPR